jgi:hypothetical protein
MTTNYNIDRSKGGVNGWGLMCSDTVYSGTLSSNTPAYVTVPSTAAIGVPGQTNNKFYAIISCTPSVDTYYCNNGTPVVASAPTATYLNNVTSGLITNGNVTRLVKAGDKLGFISATNPNVSVEFYAVQEG